MSATGISLVAYAAATRPRWRGAWVALGRMRQAAATRRRLAAMDDRMLADIGVSRAEALEEAGRLPWDLAPRRR